jgi:hypothetical protein
VRNLTYIYESDWFDFWMPVLRMSVILISSILALVGIVLFTTWLD